MTDDAWEINRTKGKGKSTESLTSNLISRTLSFTSENRRDGQEQVRNLLCTESFRKSNDDACRANGDGYAVLIFKSVLLFHTLQKCR